MTEFSDDKTAENGLSDAFPDAVRALKTGDVERLARLLDEHGGLANARSLKGRTLLHHLCDWPGHFPRELECGRLLLAAGADIAARTIDPDIGETALQWAVSSNDVPMAEWLIDNGASVNGQNDDLRPLAQALFYGNREAADMLERRGAVLTLEFAAGLGRLDRLPEFFGADGRLRPEAGRHTAPINNPIGPQRPRDERLEQALIYAVINDRRDCAAYLLDRGADIRTMPSGFHFTGTPLHWAAGCDSPAMVELLLRRGADPAAAAPRDGATAFDIAAKRGRGDIVELLKSVR